MTAPAVDQREQRASRLLTGTLLLLAAAIAASSLLGPVGLELMRYRTSHTTLNQLIGSDAAALFVVVPLTVVTALLAIRRHAAAPLLGTGIGVYALYTYSQVIIGQEYLRLPGNVERFFPLLLAVFLLAEAALVLAWRVLPASLPTPARRVERTAGITLLTMAVFLVFGQHLRPLLIAWQDPTSLTEYASSPTPFWLVKLMDLGIIVPAAVSTGIGALRHSGWAHKAMYTMLTGYSCLAASVAAMAVVMYVNDDPDASIGIMAGFTLFAVIFATITVTLYRPLFRRTSDERD